jgi:hypothetical protein
MGRGEGRRRVEKLKSENGRAANAERRTSNIEWQKEAVVTM